MPLGGIEFLRIVTRLLGVQMGQRHQGEWILRSLQIFARGIVQQLAVAKEMPIFVPNS